MKSEAAYQAELIKKIESMFPGCFVFKNDPAKLQGVPDLLILFKKTWAMLETKKRTSASKRPNQGYYVKKFGEMSFASFINPENEAEVLDALQSTLGTRR